MSQMPGGDPYTENVLKNVPPEVGETLTPAQWDGFRRALHAARPRRHLVDLRFVLPLYFVRLYFVFLVGKDRRRRVQAILAERRRRTGRFAFALGLALFVVIVLGVVFFVLYAIKCAAGIDLFPNFHLKDVLPGSG